jgi:hypothetical protein
MEWFLILGIYGCHADGPPGCYNRDQALVMPSHEVCDIVRSSNGGECMAIVRDPKLQTQWGSTTLVPHMTIRARD